MKYKTLTAQTIESVDEQSHTLRFIFSTPDVDRHGDRVAASFVLQNYLQNPVVLFGHDHNIPAVGRTLELGMNDNNQLEGVIQFAAEQFEFANTLWKLYSNGFMRAVSIGFIPGEIDSEGEGDILKENELLEVSMVNIPANAMALAKSKGIDTSSLEKTIDEKTNKEILEQIRAVTKELEEIVDPSPTLSEEDSEENKPESGEDEAVGEGSAPETEQETETEQTEESVSTDVSTDKSEVKVDSKKETPKDRAVTRAQYKRLINQRIRRLIQVKKEL